MKNITVCALIGVVFSCLMMVGESGTSSTTTAVSTTTVTGSTTTVTGSTSTTSAGDGGATKAPRRRTKKPTTPASACKDIAKNCLRAGRYCTHATLGPTIQKNCEKTCGTGKCAGQPRCMDISESCFNWQRNGLCDNALMRPVAQASCPKLCNLCPPTAATQSPGVNNARRNNKRKNLARKRAQARKAKNVKKPQKNGR